MGENRYNDEKRSDKAGILTFHCSNSFGAMLQAYGTLTWLSKEGIDAFVVNYAPPFLRGREWLIPYMPVKGFRDWIYSIAMISCKNVLAIKAWWMRNRKMSQFRRKYLTKGSRTIRWTRRLTRLEADLLIVGSDQIWNPDIMGGFRPAYFGAFENRRIRKTIAYAASFGTTSLHKEKELVFSKLLASVQDISMREKAAAEYVEARFQRKAVHVFDPVFLLDSAEWHAIEDRPEERGYILYYETEYCAPLRAAASRTAREKNLKVIELWAPCGSWRSWPFQRVYAAGPAQFLGYISAAEYVFTNSFHGLAFSILLHKPFYIYNHGMVGARIVSLLESTNLTGRMAAESYDPDIDGEINWTEVERRLQDFREQSMDFLRSSLRS